MSEPRPVLSRVPTNLLYGAVNRSQMTLPAGSKAADARLVLMNLGYHTHAVALNRRSVELEIVSFNASPDVRLLLD